MIKTIPITLVPPKPNEPNEGIITRVREVLRDAKAGKIQGIALALACADPDGENGRKTETIIYCTPGWNNSTIFAATIVQFRCNHLHYDSVQVSEPLPLTDEDE